MDSWKVETFSVPVFAKEDNQLDSIEKLVLFILCSYLDPSGKITLQSAEKIAQQASISKSKLKIVIKNLKKHGWIEKNYKEEDNNNVENNQREIIYKLIIPERLNPKEKINKLYNGPGSKVAKAWGKYFGTRQLTPHLFRKIRVFLEEGVEEELIIEVLKFGVKKAEGNPVNYIMAVLNDFIDRGILTLEEFKEEKQRVGSYEKQIQRINRTEKKRTPREELEELYKKGYR